MRETVRIEVGLDGIMPIMFDRYAGDNKTGLSPEDKMYFAQDGKSLIMPSINIMSFLSAQNTTSTPKRLLDMREYKNVCAAMLSFVSVSPFHIPFTANGEPVVFSGWNEQIYLDKRVARLAKGIPNPKERPTLNTPWELNFEIQFIENDDISIKLLEDLIRKGGIALGLGTFRGMYGKFDVTLWDVKK